MKIKYPKIDSRKLNKSEQKLFRQYKKAVAQSLNLDRIYNQISLRKSDIDLLAYNVAVHLIALNIRAKEAKNEK